VLLGLTLENPIFLQDITAELVDSHGHKILIDHPGWVNYIDLTFGCLVGHTDQERAEVFSPETLEST
jgi:hypothetical protein